MKRRDPHTPDLFAAPLPPVVRRFEDDRVRAESLRGRIARAVAETLRDTPLNRKEVAERMQDFLGEPVSAVSLDVYASQAREDHTVSGLRLVALVHATGDIRILQLLAEPVGCAVVAQSYLPAIEEAILGEQIEQLTEQRQAARRKWKAGR